MQLLRGKFEQAKRKVLLFQQEDDKIESICLEVCSHFSLSAHREMEKVPGWKLGRNGLDSFPTLLLVNQYLDSELLFPHP